MLEIKAAGGSKSNSSNTNSASTDFPPVPDIERQARMTDIICKSHLFQKILVVSRISILYFFALCDLPRDDHLNSSRFSVKQAPLWRINGGQNISW